MKKRNVLYVLSEAVDRTIAFEWIAESSIGREFELSFALMNNAPGSSLQMNLEATGCPVHFVPYGGKRDLPKATWHLTRLLRRLGTQVIHTHLTGANLAGLSAATLARVPRRIYTRHHSTINHNSFKHAVAYDRTTNRLATDIVVTCDNGRQVIQDLEGVEDNKIHLINIGFKLDQFEFVAKTRIDALRAKYGITGRGPIVGVVSKYIEWKGIQYAIPAFREVLNTHPDALLILANAKPSSYSPILQALLAELPKKSYLEIPFEEDMPALFKTFDVFVHLPVDPQVEAFGQVYVEALSAAVPSVYTLSGIAREFAHDGENSLIVPFRDSPATADCILRLLNDPAFARKIATQGQQQVRERFGFATMIKKLTQLYQS